MDFLRTSISRTLPWFRVLFSMIWLANLSATDVYFSIYVMIAFFSFYLQLLDQKEPEGHSRIALVLAVLFSGITLLANYPIFTTLGDSAVIGRSTSLMVNCINSVFSFLGGICVSEPVFHYFFRRFPREASKQHLYFHRKWLPLMTFGILFGVHLAHLIFAEYPGNLTEDTFTQISEMVAGTYSNVNTYWHTAVFQTVLAAGYAVFGSFRSAVACFTVLQVFILCLGFTYSLMTMRDFGVPGKILVFTFLSYALLPYHPALSVTIWKDVLFAAGSLLMVTAWLRIQKGIGMHRAVDFALFVLGSLLFLISRTSAWVIYLICFFATVVALKGNNRFKISMGVLALTGWFLLNPALSLLNVGPGDPVESLSIPIQQVSRVISEGCQLTEYEEQLLGRVVDLEEVPQLYTNWLSDPMKVELRSKDPDYFEAHFSEYRNLWIKLGLRYPWQYLKAWVDQTKGYWNAGYPYAMYSETIIDNPYGLEKAPLGTPIAAVFRLYFGISRHIILFQPFHSIGLHVWVLILCFFLCLRRRNDQFLIFLPLILLVMGLWFGTPVYCCFRYVYPLFVSFPLLVSTSLYSRQEQ